MTESVAALLQRALAEHTRGALEDARRGYEQVLARQPGHADALHLSGVVAHQQERSADAVALISRAISQSPAAPAFHSNLGLALTALGRTREAEAAYREALALAPDFADALLNLGNLLAARGAFEEAVTLLEKAARLDAGSPRTHYAFGCAQYALGRPRDALEALTRAVALGADFAEAHYRVGAIHASLGETAEAVAAFARALDRESDNLGAQHGLLECLDVLSAGSAPALLESAIVPLLRGKSINPRAFGHAAARLLERKHGLGAEPVRDRVLNDELVLRYLQRTVNVSVPLERLLTKCRAQWLAELRDDGAALQSCWGQMGAVATQCFLNEFVWTVTPEEQHAVGDLERRIDRTCASAVSTDAALVSGLLVLACYRPLWRTACAAQLRAVALERWPAALAEILRVALHEPLWEQDAKARMDSGSAIRDEVSRAVQEQYEENPYPRWQALTRAGKQSIEQRVQRSNPHYIAPAALRGPLRVLIAGCGTGMDAIDTALHTENARVTAIDLSRASLAYAMRKAAEYGLDNIHFRQEDILAFDRAGETFHVINCTGVLHHMQDPAAGLHRLVRLLMPDGLIKLALYSRLARAPLMEAREAIRARGFGSVESDIRRFRQRVLDDGAGGAFAELMGSTDFFSASDCRDLLFHVQETALTLPDIDAMLQGAELEFLGFELTIPQVEQGFRREYPQTALTDLEAWSAYEQRHPKSFRSMYQFWCRKL